VKYINEYFAHLNKERNTGGLAITFFYRWCCTFPL